MPQTNVTTIVDEYRTAAKVITLEKGGAARYRVKAVYYFDDEAAAREEYDRATITTPRRRGRPAKNTAAV